MRSFRLPLLLFFLAFLAHAPALLGTAPGALPSTGDTIGAFAPWHEFMRQTLRQNGAIPFWNPHLYAGVPFAANGQSALFYPPNYLHFLLPEGMALWLFALLHTFFLMLGGCFFARTLGLSTRASLLVAVLLGWGNASAAHLFGGHLTFLPARAFWPWQAAFLLRLLRGDARKLDAKNALALAACLALGLAAGAPQIWLFGVLFCVALGGFWIFDALKNRVSPANWPWQSLFLAGFLTILWCAPLLLPLRELKNWSSHGEMLSFSQVTDVSATPRSLFRLFFNGFFGGNSFFMWSLPGNPGEDAASIGLAPALLALSAPFLARGSRVARALFAGCALVLLIALGNSTPLYGWLYDFSTVFRITRVPARWLELWAFGAALLAGISFNALLQNPAHTRQFRRVWIAAAAATLLLALGVFWSQSPWQSGAKIIARALDLPAARLSSLASDLKSDALLACFLAAFPLGLLARFWRPELITRRHIGLLLGLICAEPLLNFWLSVRVAPAKTVQSVMLPAAIKTQFRAGQRWIVRAPFQQLNAPLFAGIDAVNGYEPFGSTPFFEFAAAAQNGARFSADFQPQKMAAMWRVMGASHLLWKPKKTGETPRGFAGKTLVAAGNWRLNSLEDGLKAWPRTYLTRDITPTDGEIGRIALDKMATQRFEISPPAVVETGVVQKDVMPLSKSPISQSEFSRPIFASPNLQTFQIAPARASLWVQNEALAPGWKAFVDGEPAPIHLANTMFRGVGVPGGARKIALVYDSQTLRFGLFLALCGLTLATFCAASRRF